MRRLTKEQLLTFDCTPLFPERRAYTVTYELSPDEQDLYEAVTQYVREEMNRADRLREQGDKKRGFTVGFGGSTQFYDHATAGHATLLNEVTSISNGGGNTVFADDSPNTLWSWPCI